MNLEISSTVMAMFSDYESRPITRKAILIDDSMLITKINGESTWELKKGDASLFFKAYVQPVVGDYIVHLKDDDVYHVDAVTFAERNIIPEDMNVMDELKQNHDRNMLDCGISVSRGPHSLVPLASESVEFDAPKVSKERIDSLLEQVIYKSVMMTGTTVTLVAAFLPIGQSQYFLGTGFSACVSPENFDAKEGIKYATESAKNNVTKLLWQLEGYMLARHIEAQGPITTVDHG